MSEATFFLFIAGANALISKKALKNIKNKFKEKHYSLMVVDILENPHVAESVGIVATPLLMRTSPEPVRRFIGDFTNSEQDLFI
jgi:circadian clock protein KaiB